MSVQIKIKESKETIRNIMLVLLIVKVNKFLNQLRKKLDIHLKAELRLALGNTDVFKQLIGGTNFLGEIGLLDPSGKIEVIIKQWISTFRVQVNGMTRSGKGIKGGLSIRAIRKDWDDVLSLAEAEQQNIGGRKGRRNIQLEWLKWLLTKGPNEVIADYHVELGDFGRTELAHMMRGGGWSVPGWARGTTDKNFITEALDDASGKFKQIIQREFGKLRGKNL